MRQHVLLYALYMSMLAVVQSAATTTTTSSTSVTKPSTTTTTSTTTSKPSTTTTSTTSSSSKSNNANAQANKSATPSSNSASSTITSSTTKSTTSSTSSTSSTSTSKTSTGSSTSNSASSASSTTSSTSGSSSASSTSGSSSSTTSASSTSGSSSSTTSASSTSGSSSSSSTSSTSASSPSTSGSSTTSQSKTSGASNSTTTNKNGTSTSSNTTATSSNSTTKSSNSTTTPPTNNTTSLDSTTSPSNTTNTTNNATSSTSNNTSSTNNTTNNSGGSSSSSTLPGNSTGSSSNSTSKSNSTTTSNNSTSSSNSATTTLKKGNTSSGNTTTQTTNTTSTGNGTQSTQSTNTTTASNTTSTNVTTGFVDGSEVMKTQLTKDVNATVHALQDALALNSKFAGDNNTMSGAETVALMQNITSNILNYQLKQNLTKTSTVDKLASMAEAVNASLNGIEDAAIAILSSTNGSIVWNDLKQCITGLVGKGGLQDGESCVTKNGMSISGVDHIMKSVLHSFGQGMIPDSILEQASKALNPHFKPIIPAEQYFYGNISAAFSSVTASITGELVDAMNLAEQCFQQSMSQTTFATAKEFIASCDRSQKTPSVYTEMKTLYLSVANQFVGYIQPNILESIHDISNAYLGSNTSAVAYNNTEYFRQAIYDSTLSVVASNAGSMTTYAYAIAACLDTLVGTTDPQSAYNKALTANCTRKPDGPPASIREIVYGYIQQVDGVLPPELARRIELSGIDQLNSSDSNYDRQVSLLHETFMMSDPGPQYVTCYEGFINCLFNNESGVLIHPGNTQQTCLLGSSCKKNPGGFENEDNSFAGYKKKSKRDMLLRGESRRMQKKTSLILKRHSNQLTHFH